MSYTDKWTVGAMLDRKNSPRQMNVRFNSMHGVESHGARLLRQADQAISDLYLDFAQECLNGYTKWRIANGQEPLDVAGTRLRGDKFAIDCQDRLYDALRQRG